MIQDVCQEWTTTVLETRRTSAGFLRAMGIPVLSTVPDAAIVEWTLRGTVSWETAQRMGSNGAPT